jgi:hypothetical protein
MSTPPQEAAFQPMILRRYGQSIVICALCAFVVLAFSLPALPTTVVALIDKNHHRVVLAADSLMVHQIAGTSTESCKIVAKPGCTFGLAGLLHKEYPVFDLQELAEQACSLSGDLRYRADRFLDVAKDSVLTVAQYLRLNERQFYSELTNSNGGEFVIVVFAGMEANNPSIFARGYKLDSNGDVNPVSLDVTEDNNGVGFFGGANDQIASYIRAHPNWQKMDKVVAARKFIEMEIAAHPKWVGPPVSLVTINRLDQQEWNNAGGCAIKPGRQGNQKPH